MLFRYSNWASTVGQNIISETVRIFLAHNFKNGSLDLITGVEMVRWRISPFHSNLLWEQNKLLMGTTTVDGSIVRKNCGQKAIIRSHRKLSPLDMMGMNCPCKFGGLNPLTNIAAVIPSMTHFFSQLSSGGGKHACHTERNSNSFARGSSVIGMKTYCCITEMQRSLKLSYWKFSFSSVFR